VALSALGGLLSGNVGQAVSGAAAPYLATLVKSATTNGNNPDDVNLPANVMAHALLGALVAAASGHPSSTVSP